MLTDKNHKTIAVFAIIVIFIISVIWSIARSNHLTFDALFITRILGILIIIMITGIMGGLLAYYREKYKTIQDKITELKKTPWSSLACASLYQYSLHPSYSPCQTD